MREVYGEGQLHRHIDVIHIRHLPAVRKGDCLKWSGREVGVELPEHALHGKQDDDGEVTRGEGLEEECADVPSLTSQLIAYTVEMSDRGKMDGEQDAGCKANGCRYIHE